MNLRKALSLLCDPMTHETMDLVDQDHVLAAPTGRRFPVSKYEKTPFAGSFCRDQHSTASAPVDHLPSGMKDVQVKEIAGGDFIA